MTARHAAFPTIQRRLKALGYYDAAIDDEFGPGMLDGINTVLGLVEQARGIEPPPAPSWPRLDPRYAWLREVGPVPRHLDFALHLYGTKEVAGPANSPVIMKMRDELAAAGHNVSGYTADSVPWCGLGVAYCMLKTDREVVKDPLWALNWGKFGEDGGQPELGDVLTFTRPTGGHVGFYIAEDGEYYHVLGFNQTDATNIMRLAKGRMKACRQPPYKAKPASVKPYVVNAGGTVSRNEA